MAQRNTPLGEHPLRTAVRFEMRLPLTIETSDGPLLAMTEDISSNGLMFASERLPELNSAIEFTILMPGAVMGSATDLKIHCFGRVVRHQVHGPKKKAAVLIDEYSLGG